MGENRNKGESTLQVTDRSANRNGAVHPDSVLSAVANEQRRAIISVLTEAAENTLAYDVLVERVAENLEDEAVEAAAGQRRRLRISLHHIHLPKLDEVGVIEYEGTAGDVEYVGDELPEAVVGLVEPADTAE